MSESTVVRFAAAMGYEGYPQLQRSLQELVSHRLTANQRFEMATELDPSDGADDGAEERHAEPAQHLGTG